ncbi:MAG: Hsp20/alpha crystallin family protein [Pirellulales bacterium]|nr:Hsp20/alpha crystallin family protein [Pirellulales bacterium]
MNSENAILKPEAESAVAAERIRGGQCYRPNVDILEEDDELLVLADVPGAKADSIYVKFEDGTLEIHAAVEPRQNDGQEYLLREYGLGDYYRSFQVSEAIDAGKISANYADGVLTLRLPKAESLKPRKIAVETA